MSFRLASSMISDLFFMIVWNSGKEADTIGSLEYFYTYKRMWICYSAETVYALLRYLIYLQL